MVRGVTGYMWYPISTLFAIGLITTSQRTTKGIRLAFDAGTHMHSTDPSFANAGVAKVSRDQSMTKLDLNAIAARARRACEYYDDRASVVLNDLAKQLYVKHIRPNNTVVDAATSRIRGGYAVYYNPNQHTVRQRFSLAHELAHILIQPDLSGANRLRHEDPEKQRLERLCDQVAAALLMPASVVRTRLRSSRRSPGTVFRLAREFKVSTQAMALKIVSVTPKPYAIFKAGISERTGRLSVEWACTSPDTAYRFPYIPPDKHLDSIPQFMRAAEQPTPFQVSDYADLRELGFGPRHHTITSSCRKNNNDSPAIMSVIELHDQISLDNYP